jgi:hypothetical protein
MYTTTLSDGEITNTKVVDLNGFYNFVVDDLFIWNHLMFQNIVWSYHILKFKFWIIQIKLDGKMIKAKVVDIDEFYKFSADVFFIWVHLIYQYIYITYLVRK